MTIGGVLTVGFILIMGITIGYIAGRKDEKEREQEMEFLKKFNEKYE